MIDRMWLGGSRTKSPFSIFKHKDSIQSLTKFSPLLHLKHMSQLTTTIVGQINNIDYIFMCCMIVVSVQKSSGFVFDMLYLFCATKIPWFISLVPWGHLKNPAL